MEIESSTEPAETSTCGYSVNNSVSNQVQVNKLNQLANNMSSFQSTHNHEWTRQKKMKLIDLYRQTPLLWMKIKGQKIHPKQRSIALQKIADEIGMNVLEVEKKLHVLRSQFMRERKRILKSQLSGCGEAYESHWQFYKKLEFLAAMEEPPGALIIKMVEGNCNPNTSEGENSNQSFFKNETEDDEIENDGKDMTQENDDIGGDCLRKAQADVPYDLLSRQELCNQNSQNFVPTNRCYDTTVQDEITSNSLNLTEGGNDSALDSFGQYLVSLLKQLPMDKSFQLQQKFISETMNAIMKVEKERRQRRYENEANLVSARYACGNQEV